MSRVAVKFNPGTIAAAYHSEGKVTVNLARVSLYQLLLPLYQLAKGAPLKHQDDPGSLFLVGTGKAGILNHELEHARRNQECIACGVHDPACDAEGIIAPFEACAASFARRAHRSGVFELLRDGMRSLMASHGLKAGDMRRLIETLQTLEAKHAHELHEWLQEVQRLRK